jgi:hypothetical protein
VNGRGTLLASLIVLATLVLAVSFLAQQPPDTTEAPAASTLSPAAPRTIELPVPMTEVPAASATSEPLLLVREDGLPGSSIVVTDSAFATPSVVRGRVLLGGHAAPGAEVELRQDGGEGVRSLLVWPNLVADGDGRFEAAFDAGASVELRAHWQLATSAWTHVVTSAGSKHDVLLDLVQPYVVRGTVLDAHAAPLRYCAIVTAFARSPGSAVFHRVATTVTRDEGAFELPLAAGGTYRIEAKAGSEGAASQDDVAVTDAIPEVSIILRLAGH